jgi:YcxB-like protein
MTSSFFTYNKGKVIQALRYHFISRKEIKVMMILVNVFALISAGLFYFKKILPFPFLISSLLWIVLMVVFWYLLPAIIYRRTATFKDSFKVTLSPDLFTIENKNVRRSWEWSEFSSFMESPHFFHLYFNPRSFFIVPKEAFAEGDLPEVRLLLQGKISK